VVYAAHGVGRIVAREQSLVAGNERDCVVVDLSAGLRVTLPLDVAAARLRDVLDEIQLEEVQRTLAGESSGRDGPWTRRIKESRAKLATGRATDLAELVRDGGRCGRAGSPPQLSPGERRVYRQARQLLASEICWARGVEADEADAWIEEQIERHVENGG
jgi:RNA polymerase-interacting CarD/CdnL/TRCF family regulator